MLDWNNKQNGALIGSIGIISALLQGGYVRRALAKVGEGNMARRGITSCALGLVFLSILPHMVANYPTVTMRLLQAAAVCMAMTSATVVNSLTAYASLQCDDVSVDPDTGKTVEEHPDLAKGKALGKFRSSGQLGRAIGPLLGMCRSPSRASCVLTRQHSLRILLDLRALTNVRGQRGGHVCALGEDEVYHEEADCDCEQSRVN